MSSVAPAVLSVPVPVTVVPPLVDEYGSTAVDGDDVPRAAAHVGTVRAAPRPRRANTPGAAAACWSSRANPWGIACCRAPHRFGFTLWKTFLIDCGLRPRRSRRPLSPSPSANCVRANLVSPACGAGTAAASERQPTTRRFTLIGAWPFLHLIAFDFFFFRAAVVFDAVAGAGTRITWLTRAAPIVTVST